MEVNSVRLKEYPPGYYARRRDKAETLKEILQVAIEPIRFTRILQSGNIQFTVAKKIIGKLIETGLIECYEVPMKWGKKNVVLYKTTERGVEYIRIANKIYTIVDQVYERI